MLCSSSVFADGLAGEAGYLQLQDNEANFGVLYGFIGYEFDHTIKYASTLELMGGIGVEDDTLSAFGFAFDTSLDSTFGLGYKGTFKINPSTSYYYRVMYASRTYNVDFFGIQIDTTEGSFGASLGVNFKRVTIAYMKFFDDLDTDGISVAIKF